MSFALCVDCGAFHRTTHACAQRFHREAEERAARVEAAARARGEAPRLDVDATEARVEKLARRIARLADLGRELAETNHDTLSEVKRLADLVLELSRRATALEERSKALEEVATHQHAELDRLHRCDGKRTEELAQLRRALGG